MPPHEQPRVSNDEESPVEEEFSTRDRVDLPVSTPNDAYIAPAATGPTRVSNPQLGSAWQYSPGRDQKSGANPFMSAREIEEEAIFMDVPLEHMPPFPPTAPPKTMSSACPTCNSITECVHDLYASPPNVPPPEYQSTTTTRMTYTESPETIHLGPFPSSIFVAGGSQSAMRVNRNRRFAKICSAVLVVVSFGLLILLFAFFAGAFNSIFYL